MVLKEHRRWLTACHCLQVSSVDSLLTPSLRIGWEVAKESLLFLVLNNSQYSSLSSEMKDVRMRNDIHTMAWLLGPSEFFSYSNIKIPVVPD